MYITYATLIINNGINRNKNPMISIKDAFDAIAVMNNRNVGKLSITSLEVCSNNKGCSPKSLKGRRDYLVAYIDKNGTVHKLAGYERPERHVVMFVNATYNVGGTQCATSIRIPPSGVIKVSIGLSNQKDITPSGQSADAKLSKLAESITKDVVSLVKGLKRVAPTVIVSMNSEGYNLFTTNGSRPGFKIANLGSLLTRTAALLKTHTFDYDDREGKSVPRGFLKPNEQGAHPTIGVTSKGMVGLSGAKSVRSLKETVDRLQAAFDQVKNLVQQAQDTSLPKTQTKKASNPTTSGCSARNPAPNVKGVCPTGMVPKPHIKSKGLCCYKMNVTRTTAKKLVMNYTSAGMQMPPQLQTDVARVLPSMSASVKSATFVPTYNRKKKVILYKGSKFSCANLPIDEVRVAAQRLGISPKGKKAELCKSIQSFIMQREAERARRAVMRIKRLSALALNAKDKSQ